MIYGFLSLSSCEIMEKICSEDDGKDNLPESNNYTAQEEQQDSEHKIIEKCPSEASDTDGNALAKDSKQAHSWLMGAITTIQGAISSSRSPMEAGQMEREVEENDVSETFGVQDWLQEALGYPEKGILAQNLEMQGEDVKEPGYDSGSDASEGGGAFLFNNVAEYSSDTKSKHKARVIWAAPLVTELDSNSVTVKFVLGPSKVFTRAYKIYCNIKEIKDDLAGVFKVPVESLTLSKESESLEESLPLAGLGIEPFGTVELVLRTADPEKYPLSTNNIYEEFAIPDVLTVRIETEKHEYKEIVVEIENRSIRKPFLGGYRHKQTGVEYHHAFSQTQPRIPSISPEGKSHRDTQTACIRDKRQTTLYDKSTQIIKQDHYIPNIQDKIITSKKYVTAEELTQKQAVEDKVRTIQKNWRAYRVRKIIHQMSKEYRNCMDWEKEEDRKREEEKFKYERKDVVKKSFPCTKSDFDMLYNMVERWRNKELKRIAEMKTDAPKKAQFCALLEEEIQLLTTIEEHRIKLKEERLLKKDLQVISKCAEPIVWTGYKGLSVSMDTVRTQRARELKELYHALCQENVSREKRIEVLFSLKYALKSYNSKWGSDIIALLERETELLLIGLKQDEVDVLRKRIKKLFLEFMKDPEFNPEMAKYSMNYNFIGIEEKMFYCERCCKLLPQNKFPLDTRLKTIKHCASCHWIENISGPRIDMGPYQFIMRAVRRDEQRRHCHSSVAFIMQEQDFYFLIVDIWHAHSAINESGNVNELRLPRWDITKDWTPWNCILITDHELRYHLELENLEQSYEPEFIGEVNHKHKLAKIHFSYLAKTDRDLQESNEWARMQGTILYIPPDPQADKV